MTIVAAGDSTEAPGSDGSSRRLRETPDGRGWSQTQTEQAVGNRLGPGSKSIAAALGYDHGPPAPRRSLVRVYFHLTKGQEEIPDRKGVEVSDLGEARTQALKAVAELRDEDASFAQDLSGWILAVADDSGAILLSIDLDADLP